MHCRGRERLRKDESTCTFAALTYAATCLASSLAPHIEALDDSVRICSRSCPATSPSLKTEPFPAAHSNFNEAMFLNPSSGFNQGLRPAATR